MPAVRVVLYSAIFILGHFLVQVQASRAYSLESWRTPWASRRYLYNKLTVIEICGGGFEKITRPLPSNQWPKFETLCS